MRDVIQKLIETEAEAKQIVEAARAEAGRILSDAQKRGRDLMALTRQETRVEADRILVAAVREAESEKQELLARAAAEMETQVRLNEATKQRAVEEVVRCVCGFG